MKKIYYSKFLTMVLLAGALGVLPATMYAQQPSEAQHLFTSPDEAVKALQAATEAKDKEALRKIFGPQIKDMLTGDDVQDANNAQKFSNIMTQGYTLVKDGDGKIVIEVGSHHWPMPIPLVRTSETGSWFFDTAEGKEEIINRHIGKDELYAIGVCRAFVIAQQQYARMNPEGTPGIKYAQRFKSRPGMKDGLYWPTADNEPSSPFGALVSAAYGHGYVGKTFHPFHGYYFKILTRQGRDAIGGEMNYISHGKLTRGFALLAYPQYWDRSGVMTFIVNQDGKLYQKDLGRNTFKIAGSRNEYNPDSEWILVQDQGISSIVSDK